MQSLVIGTAALPVAAPATISPAAAQNLGYRSANSVPTPWVRYAELVQYRFKDWLAADDEVAYRFHLFLANRVINEATPPDSLIVQVWIATTGKVDRIEFPPLKDPQANDDLRLILSRGNIGEPPPSDMLQPLRLKLSLKLPS